MRDGVMWRWGKETGNDRGGNAAGAGKRREGWNKAGIPKVARTGRNWEFFTRLCNVLL